MKPFQIRITACIVSIFLLLITLLYLPPVNKAHAVTGFVTRSGSQLMLNGSPFRFSGANAYWLGLDENVGGVDYPTAFRVDDAMDTLAEMGGTVVRTFAALSVGCSKCIEPSLGTFNETALTKLDYVVKSAGDRGIRLILPLVETYTFYFGGTSTYTGWRSLASSDLFYTNTTVISDFETYISTILNRVNTLTGIAYKNDPTILAWETGNELHQLNGSFPPTSWTQTIANYIKGIDTNHLVMDGEFNGNSVNSAALSLTNVDIYDNHYYPLSVTKLNSDASAVNTAGKAFYAGEYAWSERDTSGNSGGDTLSSFLVAMESGSANTTDGDTYWSLFPHSDTYGYVQHTDGFTLHYPGENGAYPGTTDMRSRAQTLRNHAYAMRSATVPAHGTPKTPLITNVTGSAVISWRGGAAADTYTVERSTAGSGGPWTVICNQCATDNNTPWADSTAPTGTVWYRVKGHNLSGAAGSYSTVYQATITGSVIVDNLNDWSKTFSHSANLTFDGSSPSYLGGDTSRVSRTTSTYDNIVYFSGSGNTMASFSMDTWFWPGEGIVDFNIYASPDNSTYTLYTPTKATVNGNWTKVTYSGNLPAGTKYLKIEFRNTSANYWNPQIGLVQYTTGVSQSPTNVAPSASITVSSQYNSTYAGINAVDGIIGQMNNGEWASLGELTPWIQLTWSSSQTINNIKLYDRPNLTDSISGGTLTFSDNSSITVGAIDNAGAVKDITFPSKTVTWVKFTVTSGSGLNVGLSEMQAYTP